MGDCDREGAMGWNPFVRRVYGKRTNLDGEAVNQKGPFIEWSSLALRQNYVG